jgi:serine/threonine protein kinase
LEVKLRDVRVISSKFETDYTRTNQGDLVRVEVVGSRKACWVQTYALTTHRKHNESKLRMAALIRHLDHPNVLSVLDVLYEQAQCYIVYEATEHGSAEQLSLRTVGISEQWVAVIMRQVFVALLYCQSKGITLKQLSPRQVLFAEKPAENCIWTKLLVPLVDESDVNSPFAAPERKNGKPADPASVLYSCGIMISFLITGEFLFKDSQKGPLSNEMKSAYMKWQGVDKQVRSLVLSLLARDSRKRPGLEECLRHPWLSVSPCTPSRFALTPCVRASLRNMSTLRPASPLKKALLKLIFNLVVPYEDLAEARKAFLELDTDMDGNISEADLQALIYRLFPEDQAKAAYTALTCTCGFTEQRTLPYSEFLQWACGPALLSQANLSNAFRFLDTLQDGKVTGKRLRDFFSLEAEDTSETFAWRQVVGRISNSMEGTFNFQDFCNFLLKK